MFNMWVIQFHFQIHRWVKEAGENITVEISKYTDADPTPIDDSNQYWKAFKEVTEELYVLFD